MRAWAKRMIWFFGMSIVLFLNDVRDYLKGFAVPEEQQISIAIMWLLLFFLPLIFMKDDSQVTGGRNGKR